MHYGAALKREFNSQISPIHHVPFQRHQLKQSSAYILESHREEKPFLFVMLLPLQCTKMWFKGATHSGPRVVIWKNGIVSDIFKNIVILKYNILVTEIRLRNAFISISSISTLCRSLFVFFMQGIALICLEDF